MLGNAPLGGRDFDAALQAGLEAADTATLTLVLVQMTGDAAWLDRVRPFIDGPLNYQQRIPEALAGEIRQALRAVLLDQHRSGTAPRAIPGGKLLQDMLSVAAGEAVPTDYAAMLAEELQSHEAGPLRVAWREPPTGRRLADYPVLIIGAGMSGLCAAIQLQAAGIPFTVIEKNDQVGGTWYENRYPGCGVDTPNHFYSYSFAPNHDWSHYFAKRDELWRYFEDIADRFALRPHIRFGCEVRDVVWDDRDSQWTITLRNANGSEERQRARIVISAVGLLNRPKLPDIPGRDDFAGAAFHTADWDERFDWRGKSIAVIGAGASAQQVAPVLAGGAGQLRIFQRSPPWIVPNPNYFAEVSPDMKWALAHIPYYERWYRFQLFWAFADGLYPALQVDPDWPQPERSLNRINERHRRFMERYIRAEIGDDPELIARVTPDYPPYGKRILIDNHWYRTLRRDNVELVTEAIDHIDAGGIRTRDGRYHAVDAIVYATGFHADRVLWPMRIRGRDGHDLRERWGEHDARAYLGTAVPGLPNFFVLVGPNTGLAHGGNQIFMTECQVRYVMMAIRELVETGQHSIEVRQEVHDAYNRRIDAMHEQMVWRHPGVSNWYRNAEGRVFAVSPWRLVDFWKMTSDIDRSNFVLR